MKGSNGLMGNIYEQRCSLDDNELDNEDLYGLLTVLRSSRIVFMSNPFVPLTAGLIREYERITHRGDFVRDFVTNTVSLSVLQVFCPCSISRCDSFVFRVPSFSYNHIDMLPIPRAAPFALALRPRQSKNLINLLVI